LAEAERRVAERIDSDVIWLISTAGPWGWTRNKVRDVHALPADPPQQLTVINTEGDTYPPKRMEKL